MPDMSASRFTVADLEVLHAESTEGPWLTEAWVMAVAEFGVEVRAADSAFIAAAHDLTPALLKVIAHARQALYLLRGGDALSAQVLLAATLRELDGDQPGTPVAGSPPPPESDSRSEPRAGQDEARQARQNEAGGTATPLPGEGSGGERL